MNFQDMPQFVPQEVCLRCDGCCRFEHQKSEWRPRVGVKEYTSVRETQTIFDEIDAQGYLNARPCQSGAQCVFFKAEDQTCLVYSKRPFECRLYPFLLLKHDRGASIAVHKPCPHILEQGQSSLFQEFVRRLERYFRQENVLEFIRSNPNLLAQYPGHEDDIQNLFVIQLD